MKETKADKLYNHKKNYEKAYEHIKSWDCSEKNKKLVREYMNYCEAKSISYSRGNRLLQHLKSISELARIDLDKATKKDLVDLVARIRKNTYKRNGKAQEYSQETISSMLVVIKHFYKVMFGEDEEYPKIVRWIKTGVKDNGKERNNTFTLEDIEKMTSVADNKRDKAYISFHFESCCRPTEVITIKLKDIKSYEHGFELTVSGKTGSRPIYAIQSRIYLSEWLNIHPQKDNPEAFLFCGIGRTNYGKPLGIAGGNRVLRKLYKRAGIKSKPCYLYWLRHSGISHKRVLGLSDSALENFAGWVAGSRRIKTYSHLTGRECKGEIEQLYGIKKVETQKDTNKVCYVCKAENGFAETFCNKCSSPLDINELIRSGRKTQEVQKFENLFAELLSKNPRVLKLLTEEIQKEKEMKDLLLSFS